MADRDSQSGELDLIEDPDERAQIEAENALRQTQAAMELLPAWIAASQPVLRPSLFLKLHGVLMKRISRYPGVFRPGAMSISHSRHQPPPPDEVSFLVEELCDYVNRHWGDRSALHLAAYVLWRTNWIHPFSDGNGRTARIVSYLILCAHTRTELPGSLTIPKQIASAKQPYYDALEDADRHFRNGEIDVEVLEQLLGSCLARQLLDFFESAGGRTEGVDPTLQSEIDDALAVARAQERRARDAQPILPSARGSRSWLDALERRPVLYGAIVTVIVTVVGWLLSR